MDLQGTQSASRALRDKHVTQVIHVLRVSACDSGIWPSLIRGSSTPLPKKSGTKSTCRMLRRLAELQRRLPVPLVDLDLGEVIFGG